MAVHIAKKVLTDNLDDSNREWNEDMHENLLNRMTQQNNAAMINMKKTAKAIQRAMDHEHEKICMGYH